MSDIKEFIIEYLYNNSDKNNLVTIHEIKDNSRYSWEAISRNMKELLDGEYVLKSKIKKKIYNPRTGKYVFVNTTLDGFTLNPKRLED